jgi:hypothetical protein
VERSIEIKIRGLQDAGRRVANINLSEVARKEWFFKNVPAIFKEWLKVF